ncbi:MAG: leucine-rich repeat protein [Saccharofermentans sp.]|nr:leucine-rich repeat protein [Saccharofermentans sp.]
MKRSFTKIAAVMLSVAFILALFPGMKIGAAEIVSSGTCGDNVSWTLDDEGKLVISGTGPMNDYNSWWPTSPFDSNSDIKDVVFEEGVTSIGTYMFRCCSGIQSVSIPGTVTSIGTYAFYGCSKLKEITIPDGVTAIPGCTFCNCGSLESITIPDSVQVFDYSSFSGCSSLKSINIPDGVTDINSSAFSYCCSLESVTLPDSLTSIQNYAFSGCSNLTDINIPDAVTFIGYNAFYGCESLKSITLPDGLTSISAGTFSDCKSLTSVTIPGSVDSIGEGAFSGCESLESLTLPDSITSIPNYAFSDCAFSSIVIPDSVISIGSGAFSYCFNLESVTIPGSVSVMGGSAFKECTSLESVTIEEGVQQIALGEFAGCTNLNDVTIPEGVTTIASMAFYNCTNLTNLVLPSSVISIGDGAFGNCTNLTSVLMDKDQQALCESSNAFEGSDAAVCHCYYEATYTDDGNGSISGNAQTYGTDELTITPDYNFGVDKVILTDADGNETEIIPDADGKYLMPDSEGIVNVNVTFKRIKADVFFYSEDGSEELQATTYDLNSVPSFTGTLPAKAETEDYKYSFFGWTDGTNTYGVGDALPAVTEDIVYLAVFAEIPKQGTYYVQGIEEKDGQIIITIKRTEEDDKTYELVDSIECDGVKLKVGDQIDLTSGSAIITLKKDYLATLPAGKHTMTITFKDGVSITFDYTVKPPVIAVAKVPASGEGQSMTAVAGAAMILAACAVTGIILTRKRREE